MKIQAVIFDCDGLMFETERIAITMWKSEAEKYGVKLPEDFFVHITGAGGKEVQDYMDAVPGVAEIKDAISKKRFNLDFWGNCAVDTLNKTGLIEIFQYLEKEHIPCAICSSSVKAYVETLLSTVSVPLHYDVIVTGDMVKRRKPDPEVFLKGAELLHAAPQDCLVLEDSKQGILAARNAGMHSCWIRDMIDADEEMRAAVEFERADLNEVISLIEELRR